MLIVNIMQKLKVTKHLLKYKNDFGHLVKQKFQKGKNYLIIYLKIEFREKTYNTFYNVLILRNLLNGIKL